MHRITFQLEGGGEETVFASPGENLLDLARKANVAIDAPCSGNGSCGKCRIRLLHGSVDSLRPIHLSDSEFLAGWRLACASTVRDEAAVLVPDIASAYRRRMNADLSSPEEIALFDALQAGLEKANLSFGSGVCSFDLRMRAPDLSDTMPDNERILRALAAASGTPNIRTPFFSMKRLPVILRENGFEVRCVCERRGDNLELLDILPPQDTTSTCGLALDLGTTTVSGLLVEMETGRILAKAGTGNGQIRYGADVINRIIEQQKPGGIERLQKAVIDETIVPLIDCMCQEAGVRKERIYRVTVASNTTMNHLLLGVDAGALRTEPYVPAFFLSEPISTNDIGIALAPNAVLHLAPNTGSYVGGDITAGTLASMMWNRPEFSLLIDLGTNGEIVFGNNEFLIACACSAGPAFEGGDISCGMRATDGAVEACTIDEDTLEPSMSVIGVQKPVGLCGSGIIDAIAELFSAGAIDARGRFVRKHERVRSDECGISRFVLAWPTETATGRELSITEVDIDNFMRAKGAIFSATVTLLESLGFSPADLDRVAIAGGIGSGINIGNAIRIGMFPDLPLERYDYIGNSSLAGAYATLVSEAAALRLKEISKSMTYLELSTQPGYMDAFMAACFLPHTDTALFPSVK